VLVDEVVAELVGAPGDERLEGTGSWASLHIPIVLQSEPARLVQLVRVAY